MNYERTALYLFLSGMMLFSGATSIGSKGPESVELIGIIYEGIQIQIRGILSIIYGLGLFYIWFQWAKWEKYWPHNKSISIFEIFVLLIVLICFQLLTFPISWLLNLFNIS